MENIRLQSLQILYTFVLRLPQNGRTSVEFCNFTNFNRLFLAVVKDFDFLQK